MLQSTSILKCTLKRCQGKRGCICPIGTAIGTYKGKKIEVINNNVIKNNISTTKNNVNLNNTKHPSKDVINKTNKTEEIPILHQSLSIKDNNIIDTTTLISSLDINKPIDLNDYKGINGEIVIRYNHYKKKFPVIDGSTTSSLIVEQYYLSFVSNLL